MDPTVPAAAGLSEIESAKRSAARRAVKDHFDPSAEYVGIGSGSTIVYVVEAITELDNVKNIKFIPTGYQSRQVIVQHGLTPLAFDSLPPNRLIDLCFDGADEVDEDLNCIKGGGACLYQEKLVATHSKKFVCVAGMVHPGRCSSTYDTDLRRRSSETPASFTDELAYDPNRGRASGCLGRPRCPRSPWFD
jgi:hypothetical protein